MQPITLDTDVLIIGGGMAAGWAAVSAAQEGARVTLVDKGFVGTSGVTATAGPGHWWVPPDPVLRAEAVERRLKTAFGLAERAWMARVIDVTWRTLPRLAPYYPFSGDGKGGLYYQGLRGPEYMRALRRWALALGVRVLDHHPALELLARSDGSIGGAAGYARLQRRPWAIRAGAVILATGGCAFRSGLVGSHTNTGDGLLMAAEAGAELSGMEFCVAYSISPAWCSTRTLPYTAARFYDASGRELDIPPPMSGAGHLRGLADAFRHGPVHADLHDAPELTKRLLRQIQPATPVPFDRKAVDPFRDRFEVKLFAEGTIRGVGGLRIVDETCLTSVNGLYAVGDAATRELVAGATSGGGAQNSAWALTSGLTAGAAAAAAAAARDGGASSRVSPDGDRMTPLGRAGLRPSGVARVADGQSAIQVAQDEILPLDKALWRRPEALRQSQIRLDAAWGEISGHWRADGLDQVAAREAAAIVAAGRWSNAAALARGESRGMHARVDAPGASSALERRMLVGGLDSVWTRLESEPSKAEAA